MDFAAARNIKEKKKLKNKKKDSYFFANSMDRRLGFSSLPNVVLFLKIILIVQGKIKHHISLSTQIIIFSCFIIFLYIFKVLLSFLLVYNAMKKFKLNKAKKIIADKLIRVDRYKLVVKRVPI